MKFAQILPFIVTFLGACLFFMPISNTDNWLVIVASITVVAIIVPAMVLYFAKNTKSLAIIGITYMIFIASLLALPIGLLAMGFFSFLLFTNGLEFFYTEWYQGIIPGLIACFIGYCIYVYTKYAVIIANEYL